MPSWSYKSAKLKMCQCEVKWDLPFSSVYIMMPISIGPQEGKQGLQKRTLGASELNKTVRDSCSMCSVWPPKWHWLTSITIISESPQAMWNHLAANRSIVSKWNKWNLSYASTAYSLSTLEKSLNFNSFSSHLLIYKILITIT